jgi:hypothetical protein
MIKITVETSQKELINSLSGNLSEFGDLYLQVASLPYFLSSIPSIRVFQYKINNYPRNIFWYSLDHKILNFLKQSELSIGFPTTLINPKKETITHTFNRINNQDYKPLNDNFLDKLNDSKLELSATETLDKPNLLVKYEDFIKSNVVHNDLKEQTADNSLDTSSLSVVEDKIPESEQVDTQSFLDKFKLKYKIKKDDKKNKILQDFDEMITRIEKTKSTIKNERNKFATKTEESKNNFLNSLSKYKIQFNTAISLSSLLCLVFIFNIFPKNVFNVEVSSNLDQKTIEVKIPESQLKKTKVELKSNNQIITTNKQTLVTTPKSPTKTFLEVNLVNGSNGTVRFDRGGIILIAEKTGVEYRQKISPTDPKTYSIPSQNSKNYINIEPTKEAEDLPKDSILKVFNLKGDALGFNFKAVVTEDTKNQEKQFNTFTESDQDTLKTKIESDLNEKRASFINSINDENNFTDSTWFKIISSDIKYDKNISEQADIVNAEAVTIIEVYSVPKQDFKNTIEVKSNLGKIMDIQVMSSNIDDDKLINATFLVSFQDNTKISKIDIIKNLNSGEYNKVQEENPSIKRISRETKSGISLPGIIPLNQVNILEKDLK